MRAVQSSADSDWCQMLCTCYNSRFSTDSRATCLLYSCHISPCALNEKDRSLLLHVICLLPRDASLSVLVALLRTLSLGQPLNQSLRMSASPLPIRSSEQGAASPQPAQPVPQGDNIVCTLVRRSILSTKSLRHWGIPYRCETVSDSTHVLEIFCLMDRFR